MFKTLALVALAGVAVLLVAAAFRPDTFRVQRTLRIAAPPAAIHPLINNMARMNSWNPFVKKDPNLQGRYRGPAEGPGAAYDFAGNREVGKGTVEITGSTPGRITMLLHMQEPMAGRNAIEFLLVPQGNATEVTWAMQGPSPYVARLMGLVFNMDRMVGGSFDAGLADLKALAEGRAVAASPAG
jgi:carbon monoxide dehydrogenase subunit G